MVLVVFSQTDRKWKPGNKYIYFLYKTIIILFEFLQISPVFFHSIICYSCQLKIIPHGHDKSVMNAPFLCLYCLISQYLVFGQYFVRFMCVLFKAVSNSIDKSLFEMSTYALCKTSFCNIPKAKQLKHCISLSPSVLLMAACIFWEGNEQICSTYNSGIKWQWPSLKMHVLLYKMLSYAFKPHLAWQIVFCPCKKLFCANENLVAF